MEPVVTERLTSAIYSRYTTSASALDACASENGRAAGAKTAAIHARKPPREKAASTVEVQLETCMQYAARNGLKITSVYIEAGTALQEKRERGRMLRDACTGRFDVVICAADGYNYTGLEFLCRRLHQSRRHPQFQIHDALLGELNVRKLFDLWLESIVRAGKKTSANK